MNKYNQYFRQSNEQRYQAQKIDYIKYILWGTIMGIALVVIDAKLDEDKIRSVVIHKGGMM